MCSELKHIVNLVYLNWPERVCLCNHSSPSPPLGHNETRDIKKHCHERDTSRVLLLSLLSWFGFVRANGLYQQTQSLVIPRERPDHERCRSTIFKCLRFSFLLFFCPFMGFWSCALVFPSVLLAKSGAKLAFTIGSESQENTGKFMSIGKIQRWIEV